MPGLGCSCARATFSSRSGRSRRKPRPNKRTGPFDWLAGLCGARGSILERGITIPVTPQTKAMLPLVNRTSSSVRSVTRNHASMLQPSLLQEWRKFSPAGLKQRFSEHQDAENLGRREGAGESSRKLSLAGPARNTAEYQVKRQAAQCRAHGPLQWYTPHEMASPGLGVHPPNVVVDFARKIGSLLQEAK